MEPSLMEEVHLKARITVYPRREILDPQGKAIRDALARSGFPEVASVRVGKSFDVELTAADSVARDPAQAAERLRQMCEKLLANLVVEEFAIEVLGEASP